MGTNVYVALSDIGRIMLQHTQFTDADRNRGGGMFALRLTDLGVPDAEALIPLSFGVVVATIIAHGFSAQWAARRLGLDKGPGRRVLLVGANDWTIDGNPRGREAVTTLLRRGFEAGVIPNLVVPEFVD